MSDLPSNPVMSDGVPLAEASREGPVLLVCLRHPGCIFTSEMLGRLGGQRREIESLGVRIVLLHLDREPECFAKALEKHGLRGIAGIADAEGRHYAALGLRRGRWGQLIGWRAIARGALAFLRGHRQGRVRADVRQLAGAFLLRDGKIINRFESRHSGEIPDFLQLVRSGEAAPGA